MYETSTAFWTHMGPTTSRGVKVMTSRGLKVMNPHGSNERVSIVPLGTPGQGTEELLRPFFWTHMGPTKGSQ